MCVNAPVYAVWLLLGWGQVGEIEKRPRHCPFNLAHWQESFDGINGTEKAKWFSESWDSSKITLLPLALVPYELCCRHVGVFIVDSAFETLSYNGELPVDFGNTTDS